MNNSVTNTNNLPMPQDLITILIPTKNRPYLLNRSLNYYKKIGLLIRLIIADTGGGINTG